VYKGKLVRRSSTNFWYTQDTSSHLQSYHTTLFQSHQPDTLPQQPTNMPDAAPTEDQNTGPWLDQKNDNGTPYAVRAQGYDISMETNNTNANIAVTSGPSFQDYKVKWP